MGRGEITGGGENGLYSASFDYGQATIDARLQALTARQSELEAQIDEEETNLENQEANRVTAAANLNGAIDDYNASSKDQAAKDALSEYVEDIVLVNQSIAKSTTKLTTLKIDLTNTKNKISELENLDATESKLLWCADFTDSAAGAVETIEINAEQPEFLIAPGAPAPTAEAGEMIVRDAQAPEQVFLNAAILPGWQKYSPTYRLGVVSAIDREANDATVSLLAASSSAQGLDINQESVIYNVPFEYMTCDHAAFAVGDEVVVQFVGQQWQAPKIIGFRSFPKICAPDALFFYIEDNNAYETSTQGANAGLLGNHVLDQTLNPNIGQTVFLDSYSQTNGGDVHISEYPDPAPDFPLTLKIEHSDIRIRFDVMWAQVSDGETYKRPSRIPDFILGSVDVGGQTDLAYYDVVNIQPPDVFHKWPSPKISYSYYPFELTSGDVFVWYWTASGRKEGTFEPYDSIIGFDREWESWQLVEPSDEQKGTIDRDITTAFLEEAWNCPQIIYLDVDGQKIQYNYERIGLAPVEELDGDLFFKERTVPVADPPTGSGLNPPITAPYVIEYPQITGVKYTRAF